MKFDGKGSMLNVPIHGTVEDRTIERKTKDGKPYTQEVSILVARGTMTPDKAQFEPGLNVNKFEDTAGNVKYGYGQIISRSQADKIRAAGTTIPMTEKDGKSANRDFVAFTANVIPNSNRTGVVPNTAAPMGKNPLAAHITNENEAREFMSEQRQMAKAAAEMSRAYAKEHGLDMKADRAKIPFSYDVSDKFGANKSAEASADEKPKTETKSKTTYSRKIPNTPSVEASAPEVEAELG